jgi:4-amino-4-deoxy-L-arabinose transferase-like glycosyltransferase
MSSSQGEGIHAVRLWDWNRARHVAVIGLLIAGAFLRLYRLDQYPLGVHQDELSNIYDGYSIAETGADRFGDTHPVVLRAFGERDYRPALYAWLAAIPERFSGLSIVSGRLPAAILGIVSLVLIYAFARNGAGPDYAVAALLFATLSPLHIQFSRVAHEGAILPGFFLILVLLLWQRSASDDFSAAGVAALGFVTGFSANAYQATRLTAVLFSLVIGVDILRRASNKARSLVFFGAAALMGALPQVIALFAQPEQFVGRARVLSLTARNPVAYAAAFVHNYWLNLEPVYLFVPRTLRGLTVARLLPVEIVFFYVGLVCLALRSESRFRLYVYTGLAIAIFPAALTIDNPATMRASGIAVLTPLFSAAGLLCLGEQLRNARLRKWIYYPCSVGAVVVVFAFMSYRYTRSLYFRELSFQQIAVEMARKVGVRQSQYDAIVIEKYVSNPEIYLAAFAPISPREFQSTPKQIYSTGMDSFTRLGKYYFVVESTMGGTVAALRERPGRFLFVSPSVIAGLSRVDSVSFGDQKIYLQSF